MRFGDKHLQQVYQAELIRKIQMLDETLQENGAELHQFAYRKAPKDFSEHYKVKVFIEGVQDLEIQQAVKLVS